jgi:hypothetical protein
MESQDGYFTSLLNQECVDGFGSYDCVEVDNAVAELPMANEMNLQPIKRGRSKNFSEEEDLMLVSAYMNVSKDLITGRDKKRRHILGKSMEIL